jgi:photosystem II stability/assembly factor-like uncharacterized protein
MKKVYFHNLLALVLFCFSAFTAQAQDRFQFRGIGPIDLGGRFRGLHFANDGSIWVGGSGAGLWRSTNNGVSWSSVSGFNGISSDRKSLSISSISVAGDGTIYLSTGELPYLSTNLNFVSELNTFLGPNLANGDIFPGFTGQPGTGVFVSTDGGATFSNDNATWPQSTLVPEYSTSNPWVSVQKVAVGNDGRVFAATVKGIWYSDNRFQTATQSQDQSGASPSIRDAVVLDVEVGANGKVFASTNNGVFVSDDNGATFVRFLTGTAFPRNPNDDPGFANPFTKLRLEIAVSPSNRDVVYVAECGGQDLGKLTGVWRSLDGGTNWTQIGPRSTALGSNNFTFAPLTSLRAYPVSGGKGLYSMALTVDPTNPFRIYLGGQRFYSFDTTQGWFSNTSDQYLFVGWPFYMPNNIMNIAVNPNNPRNIVVTTDKEVVTTIDGGTNWRVRTTGLQASQVYSVTVKPNNTLFAVTPSQGIIFSTSEQSRSFFPLTTSRGPGKIYSSVYSDDNMVASKPGGEIERSINGGQNFEEFYQVPRRGARSCGEREDTLDDNIGLAPSVEVMPYTPIALDEQAPPSGTVVIDSNNVLYPSYVFVARSRFVYVGYNPFSQVNDTGDKQISFTRLNCNADAFDGIPSALAVSGDATHTLFIGTVKGKLYRIKNAINVTNPVVEDISDGQLPQRWITHIEVNPRNREEILVCYGGYPASTDNNTYPFNIALSRDALTGNPPSFDKFVNGNLPSFPVYAAMFAPTLNRDNGDTTWAILGTENGVFVTDDIRTSPTWRPLSSADAGDLGKAPVYQFFHKQYRLENRRVIVKIDTTFRNVQGVQVPEYDTTFKNQTVIHREAENKLYVATFGKGMFVGSQILGTDPDRQLNRAQAANLRLNAFPNPATSDVTVELTVEKAGTLNLQLVDLMGRTVLRKEVKVGTGKQRIALNISQLSQGYYTLQGEYSGSGQRLTGNTRVVKLVD